MQKLSTLTNHIIPLLSTLTAPRLSTGLPFIDDTKACSELLSDYLHRMYPNTKDIGSLKVEIVVVSDEVAKQFAKEVELSTFSFDIEFVACRRLACYEWRSKFETIGGGRPIITIRSGKTPAFLIFVDGNLDPLVAFNLYHKNFNMWAQRIDLRATMKQRTNNPSTHYVYRQLAEDAGLLWFNKPSLHNYNSIGEL